MTEFVWISNRKNFKFGFPSCWWKKL